MTVFVSYCATELYYIITNHVRARLCNGGRHGALTQSFGERSYVRSCFDRYGDGTRHERTCIRHREDFGTTLGRL